MRKLVSFMVVGTLLLSTLISGCHKTGEESKSDSSTPVANSGESSGDSQDSSGAMTGERMVFKIPTHNPEKMNDQQELKTILEDRYNVTLEYYDYPDTEALSLQIMGGDIPDTIRDQSFADYHSYCDQGILAELPIDLIKENMPLLVEWVEKNVGEKIWDYVDHDGKNYSVPGLWSLGAKGFVVAYRMDMLRDVGIDTVPTTIDEMDAALRAVKEARGFAPFVVNVGSGTENLSCVLGAYGVYLAYYEQDGQVVFGGVEPGAKEALETLHTWYADGLLDPEFMTNMGANVKEKMAQNKVLVTQNRWYMFIPQDAFFDGSMYDVVSQIEGGELVIADAPKGPRGESGLTQENPVTGSGLLFGKHMENEPERLKRYLQVFDDGSFTEEALDLTFWGVEGTTYTYDETTGMEWIPPYDDVEKREEFGIGLYQLPGCFNDYDLQTKYMTKPQYLQLRLDSEEKGTGLYDTLVPFNRPVFSEKSETLERIVDDAYIDFITGARSLDEFDAFVEEWKTAGGTAVLEEGQAIIDATKD